MNNARTTFHFQDQNPDTCKCYYFDIHFVETGKKTIFQNISVKTISEKERDRERQPGRQKFDDDITMLIVPFQKNRTTCCKKVGEGSEKIIGQSRIKYKV